jgi:hypothetical protein
MCMSCVSSAEAVVLSGTGGLVVAKGTLDRLADLLTGRPLALRRQAAWDANAAFVAGLGLDVAAVLGPRPADPVPAAVPALHVAAA